MPFDYFTTGGPLPPLLGLSDPIVTSFWRVTKENYNKTENLAFLYIR